MKHMKLRSIVLAGLISLALPFASSYAQVGISINVAPPVLPVYEQPPCPVEGYIWTPGYWGYGASDYYWVPGVWVAPPSVGLLWTPPWWGWNNGAYVFNGGYWGPSVGFYGGINYGYGYSGNGYWGGRWEGNSFRYNTAVTRVNTNVVHNTYVDRSVNRNVNSNRASFNGPNGVKAQPTAEQKTAAANARKTPPTSQQLAHQQAASNDPKLHASNNKGHPNPDAIKSFNQTHEHGKGAEGAGAGAEARNTENKPGNMAEHRGEAGQNGGEHGNNLKTGKQGNRGNMGGNQDRTHSGKMTGPAGHPGQAHGMNQMSRNPQMGGKHPQMGGNRPPPKGQPQGRKKEGQY